MMLLDELWQCDRKHGLLSRSPDRAFTITGPCFHDHRTVLSRSPDRTFTITGPDFHDHRTGLIMLLDLFLVRFLNFSVCPDVWWTELATCPVFVPCGGLSWLHVSFFLHIKYTLSYRIIHTALHLAFSDHNGHKYACMHAWTMSFTPVPLSVSHSIPLFSSASAAVSIGEVPKQPAISHQTSTVNCFTAAITVQRI